MGSAFSKKKKDKKIEQSKQNVHRRLSVAGNIPVCLPVCVRVCVWGGGGIVKIRSSPAACAPSPPKKCASVSALGMDTSQASSVCGLKLLVHEALSY